MSLAQYVEQGTRRPDSFQSPVAFDVSVGATATTFYTGKAGQFFLIRRLALVNRTGGSISGEVRIDGNTWYSASVGTNSIDVVDELAGFLINPAIDLSATGQNLRVVGWGVRVTGGEAWTL